VKGREGKGRRGKERKGIVVEWAEKRVKEVIAESSSKGSRGKLAYLHRQLQVKASNRNIGQWQ